MNELLLLAVLVGVLQGVFEWLPISSEGNITLVLTAFFAVPASDAVQFSLFLHCGTAVAAAVYYRETLLTAVSDLPAWRPATAFGSDSADLSFLAIGTLVSGVVGLLMYATLEAVVTALTGGAFVALIGLLLVLTGLFQRLAEDRLGGRERPTLIDAVLVGGLQGLAILPGVSRSGTTVGAMLLRGYDETAAFRLSFLLSIPAALGAGVLVVLDSGIPAVPPFAAGIALVASAVVGYLTIDALIRLVERLPFWLVCVGLGGLAILGGVLIVI